MPAAVFDGLQVHAGAGAVERPQELADQRGAFDGADAGQDGELRVQVQRERGAVTLEDESFVAHVGSFGTHAT